MRLSQILRKLALVAIGTTQVTSLWASNKTIAVLPFAFKHSEPEPRNMVREAAKKVFQKAGLTIHSGVETLDVWEKDLKHKKPSSIPSKSHLIQLGEKLKVDYVCAGMVHWKIKTPWVLLGPKTKAECTVSYRIVDVSKRHTILDTKKVMADSTKKESGWEAAGDILLTPLATMVSGGPKVPHMNRSGQMATFKALAPFIKKIKSSDCCHTCKKKVVVQKHTKEKGHHPKIEKTVHTETTHH